MIDPSTCSQETKLENRTKVGTYRWPLLRQPGGAIKIIAGLHDSRLWRLKTLPLLRGSYVSLHVFLHTWYRATLDAPTAGGGAGCPGTALPSDIIKSHMSWNNIWISVDFRICGVLESVNELFHSWWLRTEAGGGKGRMAWFPCSHHCNTETNK